MWGKRLFANSIGRLGDVFERLSVQNFWLLIAVLWFGALLLGLIVGDTIHG